MQLFARELDDYMADLAELAERYGVTLDLGEDGPLTVELEPDGARRFSIIGVLPNGRQPDTSRVAIREKWQPVVNDRLERSSYRFELIDEARDYRRAFHRHDERQFERRFGVVVHEHCESPVGHSACAHISGPPIKDGHRAIVLLIDAWVGPPDCAGLPCLEAI